ncbi:hypothetical protein ASG07_12180 [Sphingomonas sp. Leaf343]|nr:hypothetical protein ASG07_12180 [Sphingomonas sp. Leaf343]
MAGCSGETPVRTSDTAGARLEATALQQGLIVDPATVTLGGSWARDSDRLCVVGEENGDQRVGIVSDYGEGPACSATGRVRRDGERLELELRDGCRFDARFEGDRIEFPAEIPDACAALCTGRATLAAIRVERLSASTSEARTLRGRDGEQLCPGS